MPPIVNFDIEIVKAVFSEHGIYVIREFPDGQIMWGTAPISEPYRGHFHLSHPYPPGRMEIFSVRGIINKLELSGEQEKLEAKLYSSIESEEYTEVVYPTGKIQ